jgi:hypothetical protein
MAITYCRTCDRKTVHFIGNCTDHSEWPCAIKPRSHIDVIIPAYHPDQDRAASEPKLDRSLWTGSTKKQRDSGWPELDIDLGPALDEVPPGKFRCSVCAKVVDEINATFTAAQSYKVRSIVAVPSDDGPMFEERISHTSPKFVACPDCCLKVKGKVRIPNSD